MPLRAAIFCSFPLLLSVHACAQVAPLYAVRTLGLQGAAYNSTSGISSQFVAINAAAAAAGLSRNYQRTAIPYSDSLNDAWYSSPGQTVQIGLTGAGYTASSGARLSEPVDLNASGALVGYSERFVTSPFNLDFGADAWLRAPDGTLTEISLRGAPWETLSGERDTKPVAINDAGQIVGITQRYELQQNVLFGKAAWLRSGSTLTFLGLSGPDYTWSAVGGITESGPYLLTPGGDVVGYTNRYPPINGRFPNDLWLHRAGLTTRINPVAAPYISPSGDRASSIVLANNAGMVAGASAVYSALPCCGGAWLHANSVTIPIGLSGSEYLGPGGIGSQYPTGINAAGDVVGIAAVFSPAGAPIGTDAWVWHNGAAVRIGLYGPDFVAPSGQRESAARAINASGLIVGHSVRQVAPRGFIAWVHDLTTGQTTELPSFVLSDNTVHVYPWLINDAGFVVGTYGRRTPAPETRRHVFLWSATTGMIDLVSHLDGGPQWSSIVYPGVEQYGGTAPLAIAGLAADGLPLNIASPGFVSGLGSRAMLFTLVTAPSGACCTGLTCVRATQSTCLSHQARYAGDHTACNPPGEFRAPCCRADFNQSGAADIQDLFDMLSAWFTRSWRADWEPNNSVGVGDLLSFLQAWFAGC